MRVDEQKRLKKTSGSLQSNPSPLVTITEEKMKPTGSAKKVFFSSYLIVFRTFIDNCIVSYALYRYDYVLEIIKYIFLFCDLIYFFHK